MNKKRIFIIAVAVCCLALAATGTLAFFTARETAYNVITTGSLDMELVELTTGGVSFPEDGVSGLMPGSVVDKVVTVKNTGGVDFYTRIRVSNDVIAATGSEATLDMSFVTLDINTKDWTKQGDYYYYNRALVPGAETEPLFTKVTFDKLMGNDYQEARFELDVKAQAVQSRNNTDSPLTAAGWDVD